MDHHSDTPFRYAIPIGLGTVKGIHRFSRVGGHDATGIWEAPGIWVCHHHVLSKTPWLSGVIVAGKPSITGTFKWESRKEWWVFHCHI